MKPHIRTLKPYEKTQSVEVGEGGLGQAGHRVSVHCQQGQRLDPSEGRVGDRAQQVEAQVKNLEQEKG